MMTLRNRAKDNTGKKLHEMHRRYILKHVSHSKNRTREG